MKFRMRKENVFHAFYSYDKLTSSQCRMNYETLYKYLTTMFLSLCTLTTSVCLISIFVNKSMGYRRLIYIAKVTVLSHIVNVQSIQIYIFTHGLQSRLEIIATYLNSEHTKQSLNGNLVQDLLQNIYAINKCVNNWFQIPLMFIITHNYATLIINSYWIALYYLGSPWSLSSIGKFHILYYFYLISHFISLQTS